MPRSGLPKLWFGQIGNGYVARKPARPVAVNFRSRLARVFQRVPMNSAFVMLKIKSPL